MKILIAVSGGIDSAVLLDILAKNKLQKFTNYKTSNQKPATSHELLVAHYNHNIHQKADAQQKFVEKLAKKYELKYFTEKSKRKLKSEATAREARYKFLEKIAKQENCDYIALAHHADDQTETILLNLIRGSGMRGLCGMTEISEKKWRPLLEVPKNTITEYAKTNKLKFFSDPTNEDIKYTRNFLRKKILPQFIKLNPKFPESLCRNAKIVRENMEIISIFAQEWLKSFSKNKSMNLQEFNSLPSAMQREVIREIYLNKIGNLQKIEEKHLEEILTLARNTNGNKKKKLGKMIFRTAKQNNTRVLTF
jgi:tRNA(Ile)-lysidine synthase